ncbi:MAG: hypothetical protein E5X63_42530, partial [Mesorhizobium sp.]
VQHPSSVSALRADPPSPTRGEGEARVRRNQPVTLRLCDQAATAALVGEIVRTTLTLLFELAFLLLEKLVAFLHTSQNGRAKMAIGRVHERQG